MSKPQFPAIKVSFAVMQDGEVVHQGAYRLDDDGERRAFGERCHQAIADGYVIQTWRADARIGGA